MRQFGVRECVNFWSGYTQTFKQKTFDGELAVTRGVSVEAILV